MIGTMESITQSITIIHCWSAPRSRSTALLYSFEAREDCVALDEPLYRRWLEENPDVTRPYKDELISGTPHANAKEEDYFKWTREKDDLNTRLLSSVEHLVSTGCGTGDSAEADGNGIIFVKHIAKFASLYDFDNEASLDERSNKNVEIRHEHVLLIRDPVAILSSWDASSDVHNNSVNPNEVGIVQLLSIYSDVKSRLKERNKDVYIIDSDELSSGPQKALGTLCDELRIPFLDSMLSWKSGPHNCDGPWADWWYHSVHKTTGWEVNANAGPTGNGSRKYRTLDRSLMPILRISLGPYNFLKQLTSRYRHRGPEPSQIFEDPRNEDLLVYIGAPGSGRLIPRDFAGVSPWDSSVQGGDATWEGIRVYRGKILSLDRHLKRLFKSAKALGFNNNVHTKEEVVEAIFQTLAANGMRDNAHMRLTLTRGEKYTSSMNPNFNVYGTTLIILAEWKPTEGQTTYDNSKGISLITSAIRRNSPSTCDSKIHHNNMINNILPKIQANLAGVADALMLDLNGFVSGTNATNVFMVEDGVLLTPTADACLPGITRETVLVLAKELGIETVVKNISLAEFHAADEDFTSGTMGELTPVTMIDGRTIGNGKVGEVTLQLQESYSTVPDRPGWTTELPPFD